MASSSPGQKHSPQNGRFTCLVGPTAVGKTTFVDMLVKGGYGRRQITCTTRAPRPDEEDGKDYYFFTREVFMKRQQEGLFLEYAEVHGNLYGTPKAPILESLAAGEDVVCAIDIQGLRQIKAHDDELIRHGLLAIFIYASMATVERHLRVRALAQGKPISEEEVAARLASAKKELGCVSECQATVVNDLDGPEHIAAAFSALRRAIDLRGRLASSKSQLRPWHQHPWVPRSAAAA